MWMRVFLTVWHSLTGNQTAMYESCACLRSRSDFGALSGAYLEEVKSLIQRWLNVSLSIDNILSYIIMIVLYDVHQSGCVSFLVYQWMAGHCDHGLYIWFACTYVNMFDVLCTLLYIHVCCCILKLYIILTNCLNERLREIPNEYFASQNPTPNEQMRRNSLHSECSSFLLWNKLHQLY